MSDLLFSPPRSYELPLTKGSDLFVGKDGAVGPAGPQGVTGTPGTQGPIVNQDLQLAAQPNG